MKKKISLKIFFIIILILLISISGCNPFKGKKDAKKAIEEIRTGTEGIVMSFLPNAPPDKVHVEEGAPPGTNSFDVILELRNKGAYPQPEDRIPAPIGRVFLSGYDSNILFFDPNPPVIDFSDKPLEGRSTINPNGGLDLVTFKGNVIFNNLNVEKYEPSLLATACYKYFTIAGPSVCIDPYPYSTIKQKKVCQVQAITLSNQGAPVAVTRIDEEAFARKTQFRITIKNVGGGDVIKDTSLDKCSPSGEKIEREDVDKIYIAEVKVGDKRLKCGPFSDRASTDVRAEEGYIRLLNNEGSITCELLDTGYAGGKNAYTTPMAITLRYAYRNTAEKKIQIKKEVSSLVGIEGAGSDVTSTDKP